MVTSEEVARLACVSRTTVSRVLNGSARISKEARARVHAAIATLGYEPDLVAQSLVRQRSHVIALSLLPSLPPGRSAESYIRSLKTRRVAGTIMTAFHATDPHIQALIKSAIPTVDDSNADCCSQIDRASP